MAVVVVAVEVALAGTGTGTSTGAKTGSCRRILGKTSMERATSFCSVTMMRKITMMSMRVAVTRMMLIDKLVMMNSTCFDTTTRSSTPCKP